MTSKSSELVTVLMDSGLFARWAGMTAKSRTVTYANGETATVEYPGTRDMDNLIHLTDAFTLALAYVSSRDVVSVEFSTQHGLILYVRRNTNSQGNLILVGLRKDRRNAEG